MEIPQQLFIFFHIIAFFLRTALELLYTAQFVAIFYLQTVDEAMHASIVSLIWVLHPLGVVQYLRSQIITKGNSQNTPGQNLIKHWTSSKTLQFMAGFNLIPIKTQATEAMIHNYVRAIDLKKSLDRISSMQKDIFNVFAFETAERVDSSNQEQPEEKGWFPSRFWRRSKGNKSDTSSDLEPIKNTTEGASAAPRNTSTSANPKLEEIEEEDDAIVSEKPSSKDKSIASARSHTTSVSEALGGPSFSELKSMWGDRIRKKKVQ